MTLLKRIGGLLLRFLLFVVLMALLSKALTFVTAERYSGVGEPNRLFPIVALPLPPDAAAPPYQLLRWGQLRNLPPGPRFRLPEGAGAFEVPVKGGFSPYVKFTAVADVEGRQRVEVTVTEDDYVLYSTYLTDGTAITPVNFRIWGPSSMLLALIPAVVLTWALGRLLAWWWRRRAAARTGIAAAD